MLGKGLLARMGVAVYGATDADAVQEMKHGEAVEFGAEAAEAAEHAAHSQDLGNPLTTSNVTHEKSRIRFLGLPGGIFLKMLFWKIHDFFRITSTSHKFFEKYLFTIVFAMST